MGMMYTSLSEDYQRGAWGLPQAVREIISNALDGEERGRWDGKGALTVEYSARARRLTVSNQGVTVPASALLLGVSQSREHASCIGTFGEGLPMALLVLARLQRKVLITNGDERWEPKIVSSPEYDKRVLAIQTRKLPKSHDCFSVVFEDVDEHDWAEWRKMFMRFDPALKAGDVVSSATCEGQLVLHPDYVGRVYVKGVYTHSRNDLLFGYNIDIPVGRDRQYVDYGPLRDAVHSTVRGVLGTLPVERRKEVYAKLLESSDALETDCTWSSLATSQDFQQVIKETFAETYSDESMVVTSSSYEASIVRSSGGKVAVVSRSAAVALQGRLGFGEWSKRQATAIAEVHDLGQLDTQERATLLFALRTLRCVRPQKGVLRLVTFANENRTHHVSDGVMFLSRKALRDKPTALWTLALLATSDGSASFEFEAGMLLARALGGVSCG